MSTALVSRSLHVKTLFPTENGLLRIEEPSRNARNHLGTLHTTFAPTTCMCPKNYFWGHPRWRRGAPHLSPKGRAPDSPPCSNPSVGSSNGPTGHCDSYACPTRVFEARLYWCMASALKGEASARSSLWVLCFAYALCCRNSRGHVCRISHGHRPCGLHLPSKLRYCCARHIRVHVNPPTKTTTRVTIRTRVHMSKMIFWGDLRGRHHKNTGMLLFGAGFSRKKRAARIAA